LNRKVTVKLIGDARDSYNKLNEIIIDEMEQNVENSDHQILFSSIKQKIELIKADPEYGIHIPRNKIPNEYIVKYDINNLWKVNLSKAWRMLYSLKGDKIEVLSLILDIIDHPTYNKKFGYKKR